MGDEEGIENEAKVSNFRLELMWPLPGTETIQREALQANNGDYWTHMGRCTKNRYEI